MGIFSLNWDKNRVYGLDILRMFAILFVLIGHARYLAPGKYGQWHTYLIFDGVTIFFVLSGFLIGGILIRLLEKEPPSLRTLLNFWMRRWLRTVPNYLLVLSVLVLLSLIFTPGFSISSIKLYFLFSQNLFYDHPSFFPEAWSLSVEEWFYLTVPPMIFLVSGVFKVSIRNSVLLVAVTVLLASFAFRYIRYSHIESFQPDTWINYFRKQVVTRLDSLMLGLIAAYIAHYFRSTWVKYKVHALILGLCILITQKYAGFLYVDLFGKDLYQCVFSFTLIAIGAFFLLPFLSEYRSGSGFVYKVVTYASLTSYSMYLVNYSLIQLWVINQMDSGKAGFSWIIGYALFWILTVAVSILLFKYFEKPVMDLRERHRK